MDNDSESFYEENSDNEQDGADPLHINVQVNLEESPESPEAGPPSPVLPPQLILLGELSPVWELPDDGTNFMDFLRRADVLELKHWSVTTRKRMNEEGYMVEEPCSLKISLRSSMSTTGLNGKLIFC